MTGTFRAVWPIFDQDRTLTELALEVQDSLPGLMQLAAVSTYGRGTWAVEDRTETPDAYDLVLVFSCPAEFPGGQQGTVAEIRRATTV